LATSDAGDTDGFVKESSQNVQRDAASFDIDNYWVILDPVEKEF
jgi:hypothetical protein